MYRWVVFIMKRGYHTLIGYGSSDYVGLFMDFNIYKITETKEDNDIDITYVANEITGDYQYFSNYLEEIILQIIKRKYLNNPFYTELLNDFMNDVKREKRRGF